MFYPHNRGSMHVAVVVLYALTAGIAGCERAVALNASAWVAAYLLSFVLLKKTRRLSRKGQSGKCRFVFASVVLSPCGCEALPSFSLSNAGVAAVQMSRRRCTRSSAERTGSGTCCRCANWWNTKEMINPCLIHLHVVSLVPSSWRYRG